MVTVIDLTTGTVLNQSRDAEPGTMTEKPLAEVPTALQLVGHHDSDAHPKRMPPDLANADIDDLLARWQR